MKILLVLFVFLTACDDTGHELGAVIVEAVITTEMEADEPGDTDVCEPINECADIAYLLCDDELKTNEGLCLRTINELYECLGEYGCMKPCECYLNNYYMQCKPFSPEPIQPQE